ncbi:MAG: MoxR family ATPase [Planctomycetota bacterium]
MSTDTLKTPPDTDALRRFEEQVAKVLLGKPKPIRMALVCLLADGHILVEDTPGVGKTSLAKAIARSLDGQFVRLQFTPDMLPSDILGASLYKPDMGAFEFRRGPIFTNVLLADEINRTTPRTQSALLEAMSERQVSVEGETHKLDPPFFVIATQNPYESEGTYPLPDNQLDRFMICTDIGYPDREFEKQALALHRMGEPGDSIETTLTRDDLDALKQDVRGVTVEDSVSEYMLDIVEATRRHGDLRVGVSTRGILTFYRAVQAYALCEGRDFVVPDDVKSLAGPVLAHRVVTRDPLLEQQRDQGRAVLAQILDEVAVPG